MTLNKTCKVVAPSSLPEGYQFDAQVDGITFVVTVPHGGVTEGEVFEVPYPSEPSAVATAQESQQTTMMEGRPVATSSTPTPTTPHQPGQTRVEKKTTTHPDGSVVVETTTTHPDGSKTVKVETTRPNTATPTGPGGGQPNTSIVPATPNGPAGSDNTNVVPTGRWRNTLCSCCDVFCNPLLWVGWCCSGIVQGQIMQRMKLNWVADPGMEYRNTCQIISIAWLVSLVIYIVFYGARLWGFAQIFLLAWLIFMLVIGTKTRYYMRNKYNIGGTCGCASCMDDCCTIFWCNCCAIIQMARHTHDEKQYPYRPESATGLPSYAPEIV